MNKEKFNAEEKKNGNKKEFANGHKKDESGPKEITRDSESQADTEISNETTQKSE